jgi:F-type H+-transporting ATPase subunit a
MEGFGPRIIWEVAGVPISETVVVTWMIMAVLFVFAIAATRNFEKVPKGMQNAVEMLVDTMNNFTAQTMGEDKKGFSPYMGTLFIFLLVANLIGLVGFRPPTADVNTTFALSIITFVLTQFNGIRSKGIGTYIKGFFEPFVLLFPLNILGELANPISLAFRLFGNIVGGLIIMSLVYGGLTGLSGMIGLANVPILQAGIPAALHAYFDVFSGVLQSFIFVMLSMVFISGAMD